MQIDKTSKSDKCMEHYFAAIWDSQSNLLKKVTAHLSFSLFFIYHEGSVLILLVELAGQYEQKVNVYAINISATGQISDLCHHSVDIK